MTSLQSAIRLHYGVRMGDVPADGKMRAFKIDPFRIGFVLSMGDCAVFGCWSDSRCFVVVDAGVIPVRLEGNPDLLADSEAVRHEWMIIEIAKDLLLRNGGLTVEENERLQQAVRFVEARS